MIPFKKTSFCKLARRFLLIGLVVVGTAHHARETSAQTIVSQTSSQLILRSTFENLVRGFIPAGSPPAMRIKSGQTVQIETFSHHGFVEDPVAFFNSHGIPADKVRI